MNDSQPLYDFETGEVLVFDKPYRWTSFDLVRKVRFLIRKCNDFKKIKIGHAGTLDPLATGVMILCTGKRTKEIEGIQSLEKEYIATLYLGATTPSYDLEKPIDAYYPTEHITPEIIADVLKNFCGEIEQMPPIFSAKRVEGTRAYAQARKGREVNLSPVKITIASISLETWNPPELTIRVACSKGTYIRSLAHDIGKALQSGAYLKHLIRTRIGHYSLDNALSFQEFTKTLDNAS